MGSSIIRIIYDTNVVLKDILTPRENNRLAAFRYDGEHREVQRAFIFCCYTGLRFCDVSNLTYGNIDSESMVMRFNQKKAVRECMTEFYGTQTMTRENLIRFQDTYAWAMERFGLERGIRGSEARHVDQHEYYRQCQIEKKVLEQDVDKLSTEKKKLSR